ncbi:hypothetical protein CEXT_573401 [Caerostris extrusa]|uniref:Transmembrane protein n=1 Tax=Caerostris extrusa TaxID=172846 RepID=A0AAV4XTH9_CAEEX|nr:hypothetical protein CEXT_573401 [Caerostris extrusa]
MGSLAATSSRSWVPKYDLFPFGLAAKLRRKKELLKNLFRVFKSFLSFYRMQGLIFGSSLALVSPSSNVYFLLIYVVKKLAPLNEALMGSLAAISSRSWVPKYVLFPFGLAAKLRRKKE